ncbi:G-protein coupled receptor 84-like [Mizuhopecten yessoensis]|uniref:G-protein coupled receptor 84-like n=1 Tax=Mizuhopecten yessoensis TaxID=6573 RepID=UPI000B45E811|nr:G-protein coupled receptor 84-like [Mizuhopecten yessoensis]
MTNDSAGIAGSTLLWFANEREVEIYLPAMLFAGSMMVLGLVGNGFVFYAYGYRFKKTCANVYIYWLSVFDLVCCVVSIPFEIFQIRFPLMYGDVIPCKLIRTVAMVAYVSEGLLLLCISLDRYYKICHPMRTFLIHSPHRNIFYTFILALCISWPTAFVYGTMTIKMAAPGIVATTCSIDDSLGELFPGLYYGFLLFIVVGGFFLLLFVYIRIVRVVYHWSRHNLGESTRVLAKDRVNAHSNSSKINRNQNTGEVFMTVRSINCSERHSQQMANFVETNSPKRLINVDHDQTIEEHGTTSNNLTECESSTSPEEMSGGNNEQPKQLDLKRHANISKTTFIFIVVTASFVFSYVPYLATEIILKCNIVDFRKQSIRVQQLIEVAVKTYCINNASNPIIYSIFNRDFRKECCRLFCRQRGPVRYMLSVQRRPVCNTGSVPIASDS